MDALKTSLLDLHYELRDQDVRLTVGGGYGLFLKRLHVAASGVQTLFAELPEPRATNDIDVFFRTELLTDATRTQALVAAIQRLGYTPVDEAKYFQWKRTIDVGGVAQEVKLDALVGPLGDSRAKLQVHSPRVRPRGKSVGFHAHQTDEALFLEDSPVAIDIRGVRTGGQAHAAEVYVPEAFPYLMMKLSAFADRKEDQNKDLGRHHALDAYTIVGMMTEAEYDRTSRLAEQSRSNPHYARVCEIVATEFAAWDAVGILRLREHRLFREEFRNKDFITVLGEIFVTE